MPTIKQHRNHIIYIESKSDSLSLRTAKKLRDFLYQSFPKPHKDGSSFCLHHEVFFDTKNGMKQWQLSFHSCDVLVLSGDSIPYLSKGIQTAIEPEDVRDYLIDFVCQTDVDPSVELSFTSTWRTAHHEKLIAHKAN